MCVFNRYNPIFLGDFLDLGDDPSCELLAENIEKLSALYQEHFVDDEQRESIKQKIRKTSTGANFGKVDDDGNLIQPETEL